MYLHQPRRLLCTQCWHQPPMHQTKDGRKCQATKAKGQITLRRGGKTLCMNPEMTIKLLHPSQDDSAKQKRWRNMAEETAKQPWLDFFCFGAEICFAGNSTKFANPKLYCLPHLNKSFWLIHLSNLLQWKVTSQCSALLDFRRYKSSFILSVLCHPTIQSHLIRWCCQDLSYLISVGRTSPNQN